MKYGFYIWADSSFCDSIFLLSFEITLFCFEIMYGWIEIRFIRFDIMFHSFDILFWLFDILFLISRNFVFFDSSFDMRFVWGVCVLFSTCWGVSLSIWRCWNGYGTLRQTLFQQRINICSLRQMFLLIVAALGDDGLTLELWPLHMFYCSRTLCIFVGIKYEVQLLVSFLVLSAVLDLKGRWSWFKPPWYDKRCCVILFPK